MDVQPVQLESELEGEIFLKNYAFEDNFNVDGWVQWLDEYWFIYSLPITVSYITLVLAGRFFMASRPPYSLRGPLVAWNIAAAAFSIFGAYRDWPVQWKIFNRDGLYKSICSDQYFTNKYRIIWGLIFSFSKVPELLDTMFIVLRKQRLIFLHFYHHAAVVSFSVFLYSGKAQMARWFSVMNFTVHSFMYTYYALRASGYKIPKPIAMSITIAQIAQMILGTFFVCYAFAMYITGVPCATTPGRLIYGLIIYISFMILFVNFFVQSYLKPRQLKDKLK